MLRFKESTFDHEPALCLGGSINVGVIACHDCNQKRSKEQALIKKNLIENQLNTK